MIMTDTSDIDFVVFMCSCASKLSLFSIDCILILHCIVLYCITLYCIALHCIINCIALMCCTRIAEPWQTSSWPWWTTGTARAWRRGPRRPLGSWGTRWPMERCWGGGMCLVLRITPGTMGCMWLWCRSRSRSRQM
jgi:hypothetical protein